MHLLTTLMDTLDDHIYFKDTDSRFLLINKSHAGSFGLGSPEHAIGKTDFDFFTEEHAVKAFEDEKRVMRTEKPLMDEEKETWPDGGVSWASTTKYPLYDERGKLMGSFGLSRDITKQKQAEAELRESEERYRALVELAPAVVYRVDAEGRIVFISQAVEAWGYTPKELKGKLLEDLAHPDDAEKVRACLEAHRQGRETTTELELRVATKRKRRKGGKSQSVDVSLSCRSLWDAEGSPPLLVSAEGIIHDITERRRIEAELRAHRENLEDLVAERTAALKTANERLNQEIEERRNIEEALRAERDMAQMYLDTADTIIVVLDENGYVSLINRKGCELLGYPEKEILGSNWFERFLPADERPPTKEIFEALKAGDTQIAAYAENRVVTRQGELRTIAWHNATIVDAAGRPSGALSSGQDITESLLAEQRLRRSETFRAVGTLAGGVAVSFTNVLNIINGHANGLASNLAANPRLHADCMKLLAAARHAGDLTRRLMSVARAATTPEASEVEFLPLGQVVTDTVEFLRQTFKEREIDIRVVDADGMPLIRGDPSLLLDTLMAFLFNSAEAMSAGGTITIDAAERHVARPSRRANPEAQPGHYAVLRIRDTGAGMSPEVLSHIFDPFFTTKATHESFGLGLPFAQRIVNSLGGWISVRSRVGVGTSFRLFFPKAEVPAPEEKDGSGRQRRYSVLLLDDHEGARTMMRETLEKAGYEVHAAEDPRHAANLLDERVEDIALSVIDALLPGEAPPGHWLLEDILKKSPDAKVIVTSGFSLDYVRGILPLGGWQFLQKPFNASQLLEAVNGSVRGAESSGKGSRKR